MTQILIREILDLQRKGIEPFMTIEGWTEFWRIVSEEEQNVDLTA